MSANIFVIVYIAREVFKGFVEQRHVRKLFLREVDRSGYIGFKKGDVLF